MTTAPPAYQPFYCEENALLLGQHAVLAGQERRIVFVSNAVRAVALCHQRVGDDEVCPAVWDYHVLVFARARGGAFRAWDLGSTLGTPVTAAEWIEGTFRHCAVPTRFAPRFRVVDADESLAVFASDRSHMRDAAGHWLAPPPPWPPLGRPGSPANLARFLDVTDEGRAPFVGETMDLGELAARFG